ITSAKRAYLPTVRDRGVDIHTSFHQLADMRDIVSAHDCLQKGRHRTIESGHECEIRFALYVVEQMTHSIFGEGLYSVEVQHALDIARTGRQQLLHDWHIARL